MPSPTSDSPRGSSRGKRAAERPPSRLRRRRRNEPQPGGRRAATSTPAVPPPAPSTSPADEPAPAPWDTHQAAPPFGTPAPPTATTDRDDRTEPAGPGQPTTPTEVSEPVAAVDPTEPAPVPSHGPPRLLLAFWFLVLLLGTVTLVASALDTTLRDLYPVVDDLPPTPEWFDGAGSVAVVTALSWLLATRTSGRAVISAGLALALGAAAVVVGGRVLPTGAAVMTCVVGSVYAVMVTVPAVTFPKAVREALVATVVGVVTALAAVGFEPTVTPGRFDIAALLIALLLVLTIVYRLGAGLHGLGRRGLIIVALGLLVLFATLAYAELLRRYGAQDFVSSVLDFADWTTARIGAFPRPIVVLLGVPAIVWGTHVRARRRQGWWVCAFGVAATVPLATGLVTPDSSYAEAGLQAAYSLVLGLLVGYVVVRADLALTGPKGRRGRRAEEAGPHRPEPRRFAEL